jgi:hypothetical protein
MKHRALLVPVAALVAFHIGTAADARAFEPEEPSPPEPAPFTEPPLMKPAAFSDVRLSLAYGGGHYSPATHPSGAVGNAASVHLDYSWSSGLPGLIWSIGLDAGSAKTDLALPGSTLYLLSPSLGLGYGIPVTYNFQIELLPYAEFVSVAVDHPFSSSVAWGAGAGGGAKVTLAYTFDSGLQLAAVGGYSLRWFHLGGDCTGCSTPHYSDDVTVQVGRAALAIGKRF